MLKVAPFFSAEHHTGASKTTNLPRGTPYAGLKRIHVFGAIASKECGRALSAIIYHQSSLESLELACSSTTVDPSNVLHPIKDTLVQPQLQFLVFKNWRKEFSLEDTFCRFLKSNRDFEICAVEGSHEVVIPACHENPKNCQKMLKIFSGSLDKGIIFSWMKKAKVKVPLKSVKVLGFLSDHNLTCLGNLLSTCQELKWKSLYGRIDILSVHLGKISSNQNLRSLHIQHASFDTMIEVYLKMLPAVFASSPHFEELSLVGNHLAKLAHGKLVELFECLVSCPRPEQLSVNLRENHLKAAEVDELLNAWKRVGKGRKLKAVLLGSHELHARIGEMLLGN